MTAFSPGFAPVRRLTVLRRLADGTSVRAGELARNADGTYFQYDVRYLERHASLSPFALPFDAAVQRAPRTPHGGLHGVFADALPDSWGLLLMDRALRQRGATPDRLTGLDRLAYVGWRGVGALAFEPAIERNAGAEVSIADLGRQARGVFDGELQDVPRSLAGAASSGGARPKALVYLPADGAAGASVEPGPGLEPWLVKFTSASLPLGHEEGLCEAAYLTMAASAGIETPTWRILPAPAPAIAWLALKRFDCSPAGGRYHLHSLCGLLDADFRAPTMDYEDLVKASQALCGSPAVGQRQFVRAVFNLFAVNQDDHTKNWAFLQDDAGGWRPTPAYDLTFSPAPHGEHSTAFLGHGRQPPLAAVQRLARQANFAAWGRARTAIERVVDALGGWEEAASRLGVRPATRRLVARRLREARQENRGLLAT